MERGHIGIYHAPEGIRLGKAANEKSILPTNFTNYSASLYRLFKIFKQFELIRVIRGYFFQFSKPLRENEYLIIPFKLGSI